MDLGSGGGDEDSFSSTIAATNSNLTRLSKVVGSTTSLMVNGSSSYGDLSRSGYHETMTELTKRPAFQKRLFSFSKKARNQHENQVGGSRSRSASVPIANIKGLEIPDDLLKDIPSPANTFSLFQGFEAVQEITRTDETSKKLLRGESPVVVRRRMIADAANSGQLSTKQLVKERGELDHRLDLLEIRKELASNEITEIDKRIEHLKSMRQVVFDRVADLEREELELEALLEEMTLQIDSGGGAEQDNVTAVAWKVDENDNQNGQKLSSRNEDKEGEFSGGVGSDNTINGTPKGPKDPGNDPEKDPDSNNITPNLETVPEELRNGSPVKSLRFPNRLYTDEGPSSDRRTSGRKTRPTLQQFYAQGNRISTVQAHSDCITQLDFDLPFGTMVSASRDLDAKVWDLSRSSEIAQLKGHNGSITCLQLDANIVITGSTDASAKVWDLSHIDDDPLMMSLDAHIHEITALHFYENDLVTGSEDKTLRQWDLKTGRCVQTMDILWASTTNNMAAANGMESMGSNIGPTISGSKEQQLDTKKNYHFNYSFVGAVQCYDAALATGTADGIVRLWDLRSGLVHRQLLGHTGPVTCLKFDTTYLVTGSADKSVRVWDLRTGAICDAFAYESPVTSVHFDARRIICSNSENTVKIYDRENGKHWSCGPGVQDPDAAVVTFASFKEGYLVEGRQDGVIGTWAC